MPDFSTARTSDHPALTHRVGWEVVVEHEPFLELLDRPVDPLGVAGRTECDRADRLGLTAGEDSRAVDAGQQVDDARDVSQIGHAAAVEPRLVIENQVSNDLLFEIVEGLGEGATGRTVGGFLGVVGEVFLEQLGLQ